MTFAMKLQQCIVENWSNCYLDNDDPYDRREDKVTYKPIGEGYFLKDVLHYATEFDPVRTLYEALADFKSKELLVILMAYWICGRYKIRIPVDREWYLSSVEKMRSCKVPGDSLNSGLLKGVKLDLYDLYGIGCPLKLYASPVGLASIHTLLQYEYKDKEFECRAEEGDTVIDAGGCWGDTTLYFSNRVGSTGKVYVFEFLPSHLSVIRENMRLNPEYSKRIEVVEKAVWSTTGDDVFYIDWGPGSRILPQSKAQLSDGKAETLSIDALFSSLGFAKVDFIKMDIEGAELNALKGARDTIIRCKPKLAISLYHQLSDFYRVPEYIMSLGVKYRFAIKHHTLYENETVLYAIPIDRNQ